MKYIITFLGVLFFIAPAMATAQEGQWEAYMAQIEGRPASILVDLSKHEKAPDKLLPYLVICGPKTHTCKTNGLPDNKEITKLEDILEATGVFLTGLTPKALVGTLTYNCERVNYYYVKDTLGIHAAIARMYNRSFKDYKYVLKIKEDRNWDSYNNFLYPDEETFTWIENSKIIDKLLSQGDSLTKERDIHFTLDFARAEDRNAYATFAQGKGYKIEAQDSLADANFSFRLQLSKYTFIKPDTIAVMTGELKKEAKKYNALYEGWTSAVIK